MNDSAAVQLDDVVSSVHPDRARVEEAMHRSLRWLDRCLAFHASAAPSGRRQCLFGIVQGGLDEDLRRISCSELAKRADNLDMGGIAIGGLSGGEAKGPSACFGLVSLIKDGIF